jgi:hypothetical protein
VIENILLPRERSHIVAEQDQWPLEIFLLHDKAQPDHVLHEQVKSAVSEISELFWAGRCPTVSAMIVPLCNRPRLKQNFDEARVPPVVFAEPMGDLHNPVKVRRRPNGCTRYASHPRWQIGTQWDESFSYSWTSSVFIPDLLPEDPFPNVRRAVPELDPLGFTEPQELHNIPIDKFHLFEIEYEAVRATSDLCLQFIQMLRFNSTAEPENLVFSVRTVFDFEHSSHCGVRAVR